MMDRDSRLTIDYLRGQPEGGVVRWASDHLTAERPWAPGWIDVRIPDCGPPDMAWVWTILRPDDPDRAMPGQLWQFPWPQDLPGRWSPRAVCEALSDWAARHAGRADLGFEWDSAAGPSAILELVGERAAADGPVWDLGGGLRVVDGVMDDLLELFAEAPDEAARVMRALRAAGASERRRGSPPEGPR